MARFEKGVNIIETKQIRANTFFVLFFSNEYFGIKVDLNGKKKNQPGV